MALDSSLYAAKIPAATYAVGDVIPLECIRGPAVVRSGYGAAYLKKVFTATSNSSASFKIVVKNSNWVDEMSNLGQSINDSALDENSTSIQRGHDCPLTPNSSWQIMAVCMAGGTEATDSLCFALIDIDYPSVAAIKNPRVEAGVPVTIDEIKTVTTTPVTSSPSAIVWNTASYDVFKAGSRYLLDQVGVREQTGAAVMAFLEISGAAGQNGLTRIVPCRPGSTAGIKYLIDYATPLVKGPMNISIALIGGTGTLTVYFYTDWVKR